MYLWRGLTPNRPTIWSCKMCHVNNEKPKNNRIQLPDQERIRALGEKETYMYLRILEPGTFKQAEVKEKLKRIS